MTETTKRQALEEKLLAFADLVEEYCDEEDGLDILGLRASISFGTAVDEIEALYAPAEEDLRARTPKQGEPGFAFDEVVEGGDHVEN